MGGKTDYLENKILDHTTGKTTYAKPTVYVGLFTAAPSDTAAGTEVSGNNYSRVATAGADWNAAATGATDNANAITFPTPSGSWGTITHFGLFDASSGGNLLWWGALTSQQVVSTNNVVSFAAGALDLTDD